MIAVIDNGGGNLNSVLFALERIGIKAKCTYHKEDILNASHVILPGVNAAPIGMKKLIEHDLVSLITELKQPVLGICLGMQLFYEFSEEGNVACLNIVKGKVKKLKPEPMIPIPHMGWDSLDMITSNKILENIPKESYVYFTHSYAAEVTDVATTITDYNQKFAAAMQYKNYYGVQFHPEKSGKIGETILKNFINLN